MTTKPAIRTFVQQAQQGLCDRYDRLPRAWPFAARRVVRLDGRLRTVQDIQIVRCRQYLADEHQEPTQ
jgi:hypothetical protein